MPNLDLLNIVTSGEDSTHQFKEDIHNVDSLAAEMAAMANSDGGMILIGVADNGSIPGLNLKDVGRINQIISNAASQHVRSPLNVKTTNVKTKNGKIVILLQIPKGIDKPYFDRSGVIWFKSGSDKRRINSKEELKRLFQFTDQFHADELPTKASIDKLDKLRFRDFLRDFYQKEFPESKNEQLQLLQTMNLATEHEKLNLAGVLMFSEQPQLIKPQFVIKAIRFPGNNIHQTDYMDTEDFEGALEKVYADSLAFVMRNLHKVQAGRGVNAPGTPEISEVVFEELLVNALIHRDYLVSAPIRIFIFDNRIEIISPGHLPNNLTIEKIQTGNSNIRNPILVSYVAKGLLPYHGLGSGIKRATEAWPDIDFQNDYDGCLFTVTVHRKSQEDAFSMNEAVLRDAPLKYENASLNNYKEAFYDKNLPLDNYKEAFINENFRKNNYKEAFINKNASLSNLQIKILRLIKSDASLSYDKLAAKTGKDKATIRRNIQKLKGLNLLERIGSKKTGYWKIIEY